MMQTIAIGILVVLSLVYLIRKFQRAFAKESCGGSCGCSKDMVAPKGK